MSDKTWDEVKNEYAKPGYGLVRTTRRTRYFRPDDQGKEGAAREALEFNKQDLIDATGGGTGFNDEHLVNSINDVEEKVDALEPRVKKNEDDIANLKLNLGDYDYLVMRVDYIDGVASDAYSLAKKNETRLNELSLDNNQVEVDLSALRLKDAEQDVKINQNIKDILALQNAISGGEDLTAHIAQIQKNKEDIAKLDQKVLVIDGKVSDNKRNIDKNASDIDKLQDDVSKLKAQEDLTPRVEKLEETVKDHDKRMDTLTSKFAGIEDQVNANTSLSNKNEEDIKKLDGRVTNNTNSIDSLQMQVDALTPYDDTELWESQAAQDEAIASNAKDIEDDEKRITKNEEDIKKLQDEEIYDSDVLIGGNFGGTDPEVGDSVKLTLTSNGNRPTGGSQNPGQISVWHLAPEGNTEPVNELKANLPNPAIVPEVVRYLWIVQGEKVQIWTLAGEGWFTNTNVYHASAASVSGDTLAKDVEATLSFSDPADISAFNRLSFATQAELNAHLYENKADKEAINKVNDRIDLLAQDVKTNEDNIESLGEILDALISGGIEGEVEIDLANYYKKSETYNKDEVDVRLEKKVNHGGDTLQGLYTFSGVEGTGGIEIANSEGELTLKISENGVVSQNFDGANLGNRNFITRQNMQAALDDLHHDLDVDNLLVNESIKVANDTEADVPLDIAGKFKVEADGSVTQPEDLENSLNRNLVNRKNLTDVASKKYDKSGGRIDGTVTVVSQESQVMQVIGKDGANIVFYNTGTIAQNPALENANDNHMITRRNLKSALTAKANVAGDTFTGEVVNDQSRNGARAFTVKKNGEETLILWSDGVINQLGEKANTQGKNVITRKNLNDALENYSGSDHNHDSDYAPADHQHDNYAKLAAVNEFRRPQRINSQDNTNDYLLWLENEGTTKLTVKKTGEVVGTFIENPVDNSLITKKYADRTYPLKNHNHHDQYVRMISGQASNLSLTGDVSHVGFALRLAPGGYRVEASPNQNDKLGTDGYNSPETIVTYGKYQAEVNNIHSELRSKANAVHSHASEDFPPVLIGQDPKIVGQLGYRNNTLLLKVS